MERIKETFKKNGLNYKLLERNEKAALFELVYRDRIGSEVVGYEVSKVHIQKAKILFNKSYPDTELIPGNEQFGYEGSKAFFPADLELAKGYLQEFSLQLSGKA